MMKVNYNCRHFRGEIPCKPHKKEGVHCQGCKYFEPVQKRILIIKLDAMGDVLRTTSILPGLKGKYPQSQITWITKNESVPLFYGNPYVDRVYEVNDAAFVLPNNEYDIVINLDAAPLSSMLAAAAKGDLKIGFSYDPDGFVYPLNIEAEEWFLMGIFDDIKKNNKKTYQSLMLEICGLTPSDYSIQYLLTPEEIDMSNKFAKQANIRDGEIIIGLNTGAGGRWEKKKWTEQGFIELIRLLRERLPACKVFLYGGFNEIDRNKRIIAETDVSIIDTGCNNNIREFAALLNLSSVVVTGDTLALHLAIALRKKVIALVGPTSAAELELYGKGIKITADMPCLCCYRQTCEKKPDCMELIKPEEVFSAIQRII